MHGFGYSTGRRRRLGSAAGMGPPPDPIPAPDGRSIIGIIGDSLAEGLVATGSYTSYTRGPADIDMAGVDQFTGPRAGPNGQTAGIISADITPIWTGGSGVDTADRICFAEELGRSFKTDHPMMIDNPDRRVLLVNMAIGGTRLTDGGSGSDVWAVGGSAYTAALNQLIASVNTALGAFPGSRYEGTVMAVGTNDIASGNTFDQSNFETLYRAVINGIRNGVPGATESWFLLYGIVPGIAGAEATQCRAGLTAITAAEPNCFYVIPSGNGVDNTHPNPAEQRTDGAAMTTAVIAAPEPQKVASFAIQSQTGVALDTDIDSAEFMVTGIGIGEVATMTVSGGSTSVNGGAFSTAAKFVQWGNLVRVRRRSSASNATPTDATVTITGPLGAGDAKSATFTVTTVAAGSARFIVQGSPGFGMVFADGRLTPVSGAALMEAS